VPSTQTKRKYRKDLAVPLKKHKCVRLDETTFLFRLILVQGNWYILSFTDLKDYDFKKISSPIFVKAKFKK
jgi:hypothetical protein